MNKPSDDVLSLLRSLEERITQQPVKLPITSLNYVLHVRMDV